MPRTPITVEVTAEKKVTLNLFRSYTYTFSFEHGKFKWEVTRTYHDLKEVHKTLSKIVKLDLGRSCSDLSPQEINPEWPMFPTDNDLLIPASKIDERCQAIKEYLEKMLKYPPFRDNPSVLHLLNVSPLSFITDIGSSLLEGSLEKRTGDNVYSAM